MKFYFLNTCVACPEQYDVYRENGTICGYIRLRWGYLASYYPSIDGECIYEYHFKDDFKGNFDNDEERNTYLHDIAIAYKDKILEGITSKISDEDCSYEILTDPSQLEEVLKNA